MNTSEQYRPLTTRTFTPTKSLEFGYILYLNDRGEMAAEAEGDKNSNMTLRNTEHVLSVYNYYFDSVEPNTTDALYLAEFKTAALTFAWGLRRRHRHFLYAREYAAKRRDERLDTHAVADVKGLVWAFAGQLLFIGIGSFAAAYALFKATPVANNETVSVLVSIAAASGSMLWKIGQQIGSVENERRRANDAYHAALSRSRIEQTLGIERELEVAVGMANDAWKHFTNEVAPNGTEYLEMLRALLRFDIEQAHNPVQDDNSAVRLIRTLREVKNEIWPKKKFSSLD